MTEKRRGGGVGYHLSPGLFDFDMIRGSVEAENCWFLSSRLANALVGKIFRGLVERV